MQSGYKRKLAINRQTIRTLTAQEMSDIAGGMYVVQTGGCIPKTAACPPTVGCQLPKTWGCTKA